MVACRRLRAQISLLSPFCPSLRHQSTLCSQPTARSHFGGFSTLCSCATSSAPPEGNPLAVTPPVLTFPPPPQATPSLHSSSADLHGWHTHWAGRPPVWPARSMALPRPIHAAVLAHGMVYTDCHRPRPNRHRGPVYLLFCAFCDTELHSYYPNQMCTSFKQRYHPLPSAQGRPAPISWFSPWMPAKDKPKAGAGNFIWASV